MRKSARQYLCQLRELTAFPGILRVLLILEQGYRAWQAQCGIGRLWRGPRAMRLRRIPGTLPGVPHDMREAIFMDGVTTKSSTTGARRGLGLALVRQVVESRNGMISIGHDNGAVFTAVLPKCVGIVQGTPHEKAPARP
jgi:hypothetical protein